MVERVYGTVQGIEVNFPLKGGNIYFIEFPPGMSGKLIVEVYAEDKAGNVSYCNTLLCIVDSSGACIHVEKAGYYLQVIETDICITRERNRTWLEVIPPAKCRGGTYYD